MGVESYQDQLSIDTPEQVSLHLPVAGVGSRFLAILADTLIQTAAYILFWVMVALLLSGVTATNTAASTAAPSDRVMAWTVGILIFLHFLAYWGYFTLFEAFWRGQTPGKRLFHLRVIKDSGRQITFVEAMARNLLRIADALPAAYMTGVLCILFSKQRKRLGDMAAGTLVVHCGELAAAGALGGGARSLTAGFFAPDPAGQQPEERSAHFPANAIARLDADYLVLLDTYFARIPELDVATKDLLAQRLLAKLCAKMQVEAPADKSPRTLLDSIAYELRNQAALHPRS